VRRRLPALLAATLALTLLAACRTHVGAAAFVNGTRIGESDVHDLILASGPNAAGVANAQRNGGSVLNARTTVTSILVTDLVFRAVLARRGELPSNATLRQLHDTALAFFGAQTGGTQIDESLGANLVENGLKVSLLAKLLDNYELEYVLIQRVKAQSLADVSKAVADAKVKISINPAYGAWDAANVRVGSAPLPPFLKTTVTYTPPALSSPSASATG
jgi:hypothetical protein